jgi:NADH-quinone oxidoreductase subunit D
VGVLDIATALGYGVTGPSLRASGVNFDVRRHEPYSIYPQLDFEVPVETGGDAYARYRVRMREMSQSLKIIEQLIDKIPAGEWKSEKLPRFVPRGEYYFAVEAARGSFGMHLVSDGTLQPYKLKLRTPSFSNLAALPVMARDGFVADVVSILGSIDIVVPEIDR